LNQALQELPLDVGCISPGVFERFVARKERGLVEQRNSARILGGAQEPIFAWSSTGLGAFKRDLISHSPPKPLIWMQTNKKL